LTTLPFRIDEITSLLSTSPEKKYCDFCNENNTITFEIQNFSNKKFFACEDCGRKLKKILNMRDSVKDKNFAICDLSRYVEFLIKADIEGSYAVSPHES
jgi:predicted nucleic acid-binding Zn ribbon protein